MSGLALRNMLARPGLSPLLKGSHHDHESYGCHSAYSRSGRIDRPFPTGQMFSEPGFFLNVFPEKDISAGAPPLSLIPSIMSCKNVRHAHPLRLHDMSTPEEKM